MPSWERRTGSETDHLTSEWLAAEMRSFNLSTTFEPWQTNTSVFVPANDGDPSTGYGCGLVVNGTAVPCYVVQPGPEQAETTLTDVPMSRVCLNADTPGTDYALSSQAVLKGCAMPSPLVALVFNAGTYNGGQHVAPMAFDAAAEGSPLSVPVVSLSRRWLPLVRNATSLQRFSLNGTRALVASRHVLAERPDDAAPFPVGCDTSRPPKMMVLSTPTTGFFRCAGERGAGIALLLQLAAKLVATPLVCPAPVAPAPPPRCSRPVIIFSTGHELAASGANEGALITRIAERHNASLADVGFVNVGASLGTQNHYGDDYDGAVKMQVMPPMSVTPTPNITCTPTPHTPHTHSPHPHPTPTHPTNPCTRR